MRTYLRPAVASASIVVVLGALANPSAVAVQRGQQVQSLLRSADSTPPVLPAATTNPICGQSGATPVLTATGALATDLPAAPAGGSLAVCVSGPSPGAELATPPAGTPVLPNAPSSANEPSSSAPRTSASSEGIASQAALPTGPWPWWCNGVVGRDDYNFQDRHSYCDSTSITYTVVRIYPGGSGRVVGQGIFNIVGWIRLNYLSRTWNTSASTVLLQAAGEGGASGSILLIPQCTRYCSFVSADFYPVFDSLKVGQATPVRTFAITSAGAAQVPSREWLTWSYTNPVATAPYTNGSLYYYSSQERCDSSGYINSGRGGCVFDELRARFGQLSLSDPQRKYSAENVLTGQYSLSSHPGADYSNLRGIPLHRLVDGTLINSNRAASCAGFTKRPGHSDDSCDEYPFASTYEGAYFVGRNNVRVAAVPLADNSAAGGLLGNWVSQERVLDEHRRLSHRRPPDRRRAAQWWT